MKQKILNLVNSSEFQTLNSYYCEKTMFSALNLERNENRHSAFIAWWLNPNSDHGLNDAPIKLLLRLVASKGDIITDELLTKVMSGRYNLTLAEKIELEKSVSSISSNQSKDRMDIWTVLDISYEYADEEKRRIIPMVIENKIYSKERKNQTKDYYDAMNDYFENKDKPKDIVIGVLLSPQEIQPESDNFVCITYQELLNYVIEPLIPNVVADKISFVESFVRNLGRPALGEGKDYSVLAIAQKEYKMIDELIKKDECLFDTVFAKLFPNKTKKIIGENKYQEIIASKGLDSMEDIFRELWEENESVFKSVIYRKYNESHEDLNILFKTSNKDNSKYKVTYKGEEIFGTRLPKSKAACAIFKAYLMEKPQTKLDELRKAFPGELNDYYYNHYFNELFHPLGEGAIKYTAGKLIGREIGISTTWDFYEDEKYLLPLENGEKQAICLKMWRKNDFDKLLEWVNKKYKFIKIEQCP
jgi:hypothetical protein